MWLYLPGIITSVYADSRSLPQQRREIVFLTKPFTLDQMKATIGAVFVEARGGGVICRLAP